MRHHQIIRFVGLCCPRSASLCIPVLENVLLHLPPQPLNPGVPGHGHRSQTWGVCPSGHLSLSGMAHLPGEGPIPTTSVFSGRASVSWTFSPPSCFQDTGQWVSRGSSSRSLTLAVMGSGAAGLAPRLWLLMVVCSWLGAHLLLTDLPFPLTLIRNL